MDGDDVFARALRSAIERSGLSLSQIGHRLRARGRAISSATLSNWQSGRSRPGGPHSLAVLTALEEILGQSPGTLIDLVGAPRPRGRAMRHAEISKFVPARGSAHEALSELGFRDPQDYPHEQFVHELLLLDSSQDLQTVIFRIMVRALRDGRCRLPSVHVLTEQEIAGTPRIVALEGCRTGRRISCPDTFTFGAEIVVDGNLETGQQAMIAYRVELPVPATSISDLHYAFPRRAHDILVEAEFRGGALPASCVGFRRAEGEEVSRTVRRDTRDRIQMSANAFGPGAVGLRWDWGTSEGWP